MNSTDRAILKIPDLEVAILNLNQFCKVQNLVTEKMEAEIKELRMENMILKSKLSTLESKIEEFLDQ